MTIKLSDKEFKNLVNDLIADEFNLPGNTDFRISFSYTGVEITTLETESEEEKGDEPA
jgi:hypothetical protein